MSLFKQFTHVSITVTDVAKAREFYTDTWGSRRSPAPRSTSRHLYSLGGDLQLHIILNDQLVRPAVEREKIEARYRTSRCGPTTATGRPTGSASSASSAATSSPAPPGCARCS